MRLPCPIIPAALILAAVLSNSFAGTADSKKLKMIEVTGPRAVIRPSPGDEYKPMGHISGGPYEQIDKAGKWRKIRFTGWIHDSQLKSIPTPAAPKWHTEETVFIWRIDRAGKASRVPSAPESGRYMMARTRGAHAEAAKRVDFHYFDPAAVRVEMLAPFIWNPGSCEKYELDPDQKAAKGREPLVKRDGHEFSQCVFLKPGRYSFRLEVNGMKFPVGQRLWFDVPLIPQ